MSGGFAGHCDWRLPQIDELRTIIDTSVAGCGSDVCIDPIFGPTESHVYWSATTNSSTPGDAWIASFFADAVNFTGKAGNFYVRAVRGGSN